MLDQQCLVYKVIDVFIAYLDHYNAPTSCSSAGDYDQRKNLCGIISLHTLGDWVLTTCVRLFWLSLTCLRGRWYYTERERPGGVLDEVSTAPTATTGNKVKVNM